MSVKSTDSVDKAVGRRIRALRLAAGLSQSALAEPLGLTFQQVQKYEKGSNRVGAGRLIKIAGILNTSVSALIDDGAKDASEHNNGSDVVVAMLGATHGRELAEAFVLIKDNQDRHALLRVARAMGK